MFKYHLYLFQFQRHLKDICLNQWLIMQFEYNSLLKFYRRQGSTGSWSGSTKHNQWTQFLTSIGLTGRINSVFNIVFSIIIFLPIALDNRIRLYPSMNNLQKAAYQKTPVTPANFRSSAVFFISLKPFQNSCKVVWFFFFFLSFLYSSSEWMEALAIYLQYLKTLWRNSKFQDSVPSTLYSNSQVIILEVKKRIQKCLLHL